MDIVLSHSSALEFWRSGKERILLRRDCACDWETAAGGRRKLHGTDIGGLGEKGFGFLTNPIHLLMGSEKDRGVRRSAICHLCTKELPPGSLVRIGEGIYACRPELAFIQQARQAMFPATVLTGLEICGAFRMPVGNGPGLFQRPPLASVASLASYIDQCKGMHGSAAALRAILYIADGCESPMEVKLVIILCFPVRLGGYGLPMPVLNRAIPTTDEIRRATGRSSFRCDLLWPEAGIAVEYDGKGHETRIASDRIRSTALADLGIKEQIVVTIEQMENEVQLDYVVSRLMRLLGIERKPTACDWSGARRDLRRALGLD